MYVLCMYVYMYVCIICRTVTINSYIHIFQVTINLIALCQKHLKMHV